MEKAVIIGARANGHAKVVLEILLAAGQYEVVGFIDDDPDKKGQAIRNFPVLGGMKDLPELKTSLDISGAIVAIGHNEMRRTLSQQIISHGLELINAIHPSAIIDSDVEIGQGNYIAQGAILVTGTRVGNAVNIHTGTTVDHDNVIEDGANLAPGVHTAGRVHIGRDAFLGTGTCVIPDIHIGEGAITGAGTTVIRNILSHTKVVGNPAREINYSKQ